MIDMKDRTKSTADVECNGQTVIVEYWWSWRNQLSETEFNDYLQLEALDKLQLYDDARALAEPKATGALTVTISEDGTTTINDTRNWYQNWIDNNL